MTHWTGTRSGWNTRGTTPLAEQMRQKRQRFESLGLQAIDLLGEQNYVKLVDHMPDHADYAEAVLWMEELVKIGKLLQGHCIHPTTDIDEDYSMRLVGGDLIEYERYTLWCTACGRSLVTMNLA